MLGLGGTAEARPFPFQDGKSGLVRAMMNSDNLRHLPETVGDALLPPTLFSQRVRKESRGTLILAVLGLRVASATSARRADSSRLKPFGMTRI